MLAQRKNRHSHDSSTCTDRFSERRVADGSRFQSNQSSAIGSTLAQGPPPVRCSPPSNQRSNCQAQQHRTRWFGNNKHVHEGTGGPVVTQYSSVRLSSGPKVRPLGAVSPPSEANTSIKVPVVPLYRNTSFVLEVTYKFSSGPKAMPRGLRSPPDANTVNVVNFEHGL